MSALSAMISRVVLCKVSGVSRLARAGKVWERAEMSS